MPYYDHYQAERPKEIDILVATRLLGICQLHLPPVNRQRIGLVLAVNGAALVSQL